MASVVSEEIGGGDDGDDGLIFPWGRRARGRWRLAMMIVLSLLAHAASFYVLQVAYTPTGTQLPPPAQVVLVPLDQPEYAPLARWLAMDDPSLMTHSSPPVASQVLGSLGFRYVPSYDAGAPPFKPLPPAPDPLAAEPPRPRLPGPVPFAPAALAPPASPGAPRPAVRARPSPVTRLVLTGALENAAAPLPAIRFDAGKSTAVLDPTVFLVGVPTDESQPLLFRQGSSGNAAADEFARGYLAGIKFRPDPAAADGPGVAWGWASFYWGNDIYR